MHSLKKFDAKDLLTLSTTAESKGMKYVMSCTILSAFAF